MFTIKERYPEQILPYLYETSVTKGGMDAICKVLLSILKTSQEENNNSKNEITIIPICTDEDSTYPNVEEIYFEISKLVEEFSKTPCRYKTIISGISCARFSPTGKYNEEEIIQSAIEEGSNILILDNTVELPDREIDPIYKILADPRITQKLEKGELLIFLTKSLQKFGTLGTQKVRAGNLSIFGKKDHAFLKKIYYSLQDMLPLYSIKDWKPEMQWMTHLLKANHKNEIKFLEKCMNNTNLFFELLKSKIDSCTTKQQTKINEIVEYLNPSFSMIITKKDILEDTFFQGLQSFGYSFTCFSAYPGGSRLNLGLEPKCFIEELIARIIENSENLTLKYFKDHQDYIESLE